MYSSHAEKEGLALLKIEIKSAPSIRVAQENITRAGKRMWAIGYSGVVTFHELLSKEILLEPTIIESKRVLVVVIGSIAGGEATVATILTRKRPMFRKDSSGPGQVYLPPHHSHYRHRLQTNTLLPRRRPS